MAEWQLLSFLLMGFLIIIVEIKKVLLSGECLPLCHRLRYNSIFIGVSYGI